MAYQGVIALSFFLLTLSFSLSNPSPNPTAFRVDLHHCDSVHSPLHDPSASPYALRKLAVERSISRHNALQWEISGKYSPSDLRTDMKRIPGEYLMKISIGTPPQPFWLSFDTGSDLVWTQCEPCANCFEQDGEKYDPENSCTFVALEGTAPLCQAYHGGTPPANPCPYTVVYLDQSHSTGILATESFTFETSRVDATTTNPLSSPYRINANPGYNSSASNNPLSSPCKTNSNPHYSSSATTNPRSNHIFAKTNPSSTINLSSDSTPSSNNGTIPSASTTSTSPSVTIITTNDAIQTVITGIGFGCGRTNTGNFVPAMAGVAGLGGGPLSLTSQLGGIIAGKYSYCLTLSTATDAMGKLIFGDNPVFDGPNTKRTQILRDPNIPTYHFLGLEGISVGNKRLNIPVGTFDSGRFIIDSGTTLNFLANGGYGPLTDELKDVIQLEAANDPSTDPDIVLELCYKKPNNYEGIPDITYHFSGGADWIMPPQNSFEVASADVICLALRPADEQLQLSIMGNMAQQNMVVEFNVNDNILSFVPADCTAL
ncbi:aspartic proteinase CDR1 [Amborella trichopoda]|uniref:Peptidase A1 domain-containing protein n=1 Tax=Amborella trichopoda TaxID=13333 RepID=W1NRQ7_AMBTC|nr:aspartic proteinase CDR1 [Amborella trichopoda]ERM98238.1 hypothetical protein AMTR_s00095p00161600 [Amborella trichopoda]|eukprot:XP_006832960.1 aspartic proteinase CDR1 [Amborella trichopoda]